MNPYECMYVLPKDQYRALVGKPPLNNFVTHSSRGDSHFSPDVSHSSLPANQSSLCSVCGRDFKHSNILAHHMKEHVSGLKCNICSKTMKNSSSLRKHLIRHRPQAGPGAEPSAARAGPFGSKAGRPQAAEPSPELRCGICDKKMKHKHNLTRHMKSHTTALPFKASKWETL